MRQASMQTKSMFIICCTDMPVSKHGQDIAVMINKGLNSVSSYLRESTQLLFGLGTCSITYLRAYKTRKMITALFF